jgi:aldehyde dehydrogenase (NAD+)
MDETADLAFLHVAPTRIVFGAGACADAGVELSALGCRRALVVTDKGLTGGTDIVSRVVKALGASCAGVFDEVPPDSGVHVVDAAASEGRRFGADSVVSVGGGSVIDTAKGIAILLTEGGSLRDWQGFQMLSRRQAPHVSIPTTAGTGSECTYVAVIKDHEAGRKLLFGDHHIIPDVAILDPAVTAGLPPFLTAATGMDALSHGLEAVTSAQREPVADALGLHAIRLVRRYLPRALADGSDLAARGQMLAAASMAGAAFSNAQVGLAHAIAHVVGARHGVHHGAAVAIALPHVMRFNNASTAARQAMVAEALGLDTRGVSDEAAGLAAADAVEALARRSGLPRSFRDAGVPESDLPECAALALSDGSIVYNGREVAGPEEVLAVLEAAWRGDA